ncbi:MULTISPECIES: class I SAM-dependent methyltransferase [unclassified Francisella]|uniref:class I SAM-dependent methyltransferase n=1 Tax=unclassified Francisella TaxID=2610885 RepID=UPI002E30F1F7|nr:MULTISPECIES: class I SAM-dependent methyltransferase [unclassified Francisella]MED7819342.1 class I SAM-dependent methyltransferase [Francisella sp. 19S2-4]MED7830118.1 class I SAM-dependent methyltransferase [Francisella sp. 19S2-10]
MNIKERIIIRYLAQRWYKKALVITNNDQAYLDNINVLKKVVCSGYLKTQYKKGCIFDVEAWPFEYKFFDLVVLDQNFSCCFKEMKALLKQLHFCLADDGEVIVACSGDVRLYRIVSKFLANGFVSKKVQLINPTGNIFIDLFKRVISKNYVVIFKKDNFFIVDGLKVSDLVTESGKKRAYRGECAKEIYGDFQQKK